MHRLEDGRLRADVGTGRDAQSADQARRARPLRGSNKIEMCKSEVSDALQTLDQRSHFNVVAFADKVDPWKKNPVPASKGNVDEAISWVQNRVSGGETNYYDALRAVRGRSGER